MELPDAIAAADRGPDAVENEVEPITQLRERVVELEVVVERAGHGNEEVDESAQPPGEAPRVTGGSTPPDLGQVAAVAEQPAACHVRPVAGHGHALARSGHLGQQPREVDAGVD